MYASLKMQQKTIKKDFNGINVRFVYINQKIRFYHLRGYSRDSHESILGRVQLNLEPDLIIFEEFIL